ncbi:hypothetical protein B0H21DRAFT_738340 [Amylocystis lapponica]|nr:hypothetical protein B0H21DRAFT_738340 [Amylocystis lapponica]
MMGYMRDDGASFISYPKSGNLTAGLIAQDLPTTVVNNSLFSPPTGPNATLDVFNVTVGVARSGAPRSRSEGGERARGETRVPRIRGRQRRHSA